MVRTLPAPWVVFFALIFFTIGASSHMMMTSPAPINSPKNPFASKANYDYVNPLSASGSDFPCKGQHTLLDSSDGQPVAQWVSGQSYSMTIDGGAFHSGGSCQASLSFDGGQTFKVIHSYVGNCPSANGETSYEFTVPSDSPSAERAIFAWSWFNKIGNREMYMNCAVVSISGDGAGLDDRPDMFVANIGNGCATGETYDVAFPDPGADVTVQGSNTAPPTGNCGSGPGLTNPGDQGGSDGAGEHRPGESSPAGGEPTDVPAPPVGKPRIGPPPAEGQSPFEGAPPVEEQPPTPEPSSLPGQGAPDCQCSAVANYVPGNDWPDWYNHAERLRPCVFNVILGQLGWFGMPYVARFFAV